MNNLYLWKKAAASVGYYDAISNSYCHREHKPCVKWVEKYFKDCLCNLSDDLSFGFGIISLVAWGVAEIPQIITNFHSKSGHGVSILFLLTWFIGDIFNLAGCVLEPATLPTQLYTALLYTASTVVLVLQSIYYDYFCRWRKQKQNRSSKFDDKKNHEDETKIDQHKQSNYKSLDENGRGGARVGGGGGIPIPSRRDYYYTSARSLAGSDTPPFKSNSYLSKARSGPSAMIGGDLLVHTNDNEDDNYYSCFGDGEDNKTSTITQPRSIPRAVARGAALMAATVNLQIHTTDAAAAAAIHHHMRIGFTGRRLLQEGEYIEHSGVGQWLGWLMAAIYMGGRIPQIVLNIKRASVEGMNPLMFIFALIANVAYVASILVRSTEWSKIKANMPWLLDALGCVALDLFIILQYVYYKYIHKHNDDFNLHHHHQEEEDEKKEPLISHHGIGNKT